MSELNFHVSVDGIDIRSLINQMGGTERVKQYQRGELVLIERVTEPEPPLDFTIRVDRSVKPAYPSWSDKVMHPELECTGPAEYNLQQDVEQWLRPDQPSVVRGRTIYKALKRDSALADQLGLSDLLAIQAKGIAVFRALFKTKAVFGWKSVVRDRDNHYLFVPCLYEGGDEVVLSWYWLGNVWSAYRPALRFRK